MLDQKTPEALFLAHLDWIDRVAQKASRKQGRSEADADDFAAWVRMKMVEDDYAAIRKFRGESNLKTFLVTVVMRFSSAYGREQRGRWRPSAAAEKLGPPAPALEQLVRRDRYPLSQAAEKLRTEGLTTLTDLELARLLEKIPERAPLRPEEVEAETVLEHARSHSHADERIVAAGERASRREGLRALAGALRQLAPEDRLIAKMHFRDGHTLADVARRLNLDQKPLYRRVPKLRARLRQLLVDAGFSAAMLRELLGGEDE